MSENKSNNNSNKNANNFKNRDFILDGKVSEESIRKIVEKIISINRYDEEHRHELTFDEKPINIIINTYGGSLYDANLMIGVMETSKTPIHTYCHGKAMSAGFYIFSAGHRRFATQLATFMYHDASVGLHNSIEGLKEDIEWYERLRDQYDLYMLSVTNIPKDIMDYKKERKQDWYMTALEAFKYGLVDEIIPFRSQK